MTRKNSLFTFIILLFLIALNACEKHNLKENEANYVVEKEFDSLSANQYFNQKSPLEQWEFVYEILQNKPIHTTRVEEWINNKLPQLFKNKQQLTVQLLRDINDELYHSDLYELQFTIAQFTFNHFGSDKYIHAHATAAMILGSHYNFYKQKDSMAKYVNKLDKSIEHDTASWLKLGLYTNKANLAILQEDYFDAVVNYHKAIETTKPYDFNNLSTLYQNLSGIYLQLAYLDKAYSYSQKALNMVGIEHFSIENLINYGILQFKTGMLDSAELTYNRIINKAIETNSSGLLAQVYSNYGNLKNKQGLYDQAHHYLNLSDSICKEMNIEIGLFINLINRLEVWLDQGDFETLLKMIPIAENMGNLFNNEHLNMELYGTISRIYEKKENEALANQYFGKYHRIKQKTKGDNPSSIITEWELSKENENLLLANAQYENDLLQQIQYKYQIALLLSLAVIILSIIYFYLYKNNRKKQIQLVLIQRKIENELEIKSKELLSDSIKNISIQQTKDWINQEITEIVQQLPRVHHHYFEKLSKKLKNTNNHSYMDEFDTRFTGVYEAFYVKIKTMAPDLTPNEIRICAMIKLNISTKEIAMLSNRTIGTVENIRISIRKKLQLSNEINLQEFLLNL